MKVARVEGHIRGSVNGKHEHVYQLVATEDGRPLAVRYVACEVLDDAAHDPPGFLEAVRELEREAEGLGYTVA
jgi:hypothetical protein